MTSLEVNAHIGSRTIHPANASNLRSGDTVRAEMTFGPGLAIVDHLAHHIGSIVEDADSDSFRASHVTSTGYGGPGLDLGELGGSVVPAAFAVVALLYHAMFHVLVVDTINSFSMLWNNPSCETVLGVVITGSWVQVSSIQCMLCPCRALRNPELTFSPSFHCLSPVSNDNPP